MDNGKKKNRRLAYIVTVILQMVGIFLIVYLFVLPFYPSLLYSFHKKDKSVIENISEVASSSAVAVLKKQAENFRNSLPQAEYSVSKNRLIIPKIGVNAPIVEASNEQVGLSKGSWRVPDSSTPDKGGNTVLTGHRFRYLPPNNLTFFLFNKLAKGDIVTVLWEDKEYVYKVRETKVVPSTEISIMDQTKEPIITMYTCDPIYSTKNRLVVVADLVD